jgi:phage FluMu gp28-like protein
MTQTVQLPALIKPATPSGVLLAGQKRWLADRSPVKVAVKSRRVGFSWSEAADSVLEASRTGGMDVWYIGYTKDMAQEFILDCADWVRDYALALEGNIEEGSEELYIDGEEKKTIFSFSIKFPSGFRITALSSSPRNLRGKQGRIVIDEAAFHDDLAGLLKAAIALLIWGGCLHVISTYNGTENPFYDLVEDCKSGKLDYSLHHYDFDQALSDGLYERVCLRTGKVYALADQTAYRAGIVRKYGSDADEELFCIPSQGSGAYLSRGVIESAMLPGVPVLRLSLKNDFTMLPEAMRRRQIDDWLRMHLKPVLQELPRFGRYVFGMDFGRIHDLSYLFPLLLSDDKKLTAPFTVELRNVPFETQKQVLWYVLDHLPVLLAGAMDARGNGHWLAEVTAQQFGFNRVEMVMLTESWYVAHMPKLKSGLEEKTLLIPADEDLKNDLRSLRMHKGVAKVPDNAKMEGSDGQPRHGDGAPALALAVYAATSMVHFGGDCIEVPRRKSGDDDAFRLRPDRREDRYAAFDRGWG